jgi:hypothetical protein
MMLTAKTRQSKNAFIIFISAEIMIALAAILVDGISLEALHTTTRFSGRLSLIFFSAMLITRHEPETVTKFLSNKPYLLFAVLHGIHLIELLFYIQLSGNKLIPLRLLGGFVGYVFIFLLPYLSYLQIKEKISTKAFHVCELIYFPYLWFIFFMSYLPRVMKTLPNVGGAYWEHVVLFIWVIVLGVVSVFYKRRVIPAPHAS